MFIALLMFFATFRAKARAFSDSPEPLFSGGFDANCSSRKVGPRGNHPQVDSKGTSKYIIAYKIPFVKNIALAGVVHKSW